MPRTKIERPSPEKLKEFGIESWSEWSCDPSEFSWEYSFDETAFINEGVAIVTEEGGEQVKIEAGDLVKFPKGLKCRWKVLDRIEKVYTGGDSTMTTFL